MGIEEKKKILIVSYFFSSKYETGGIRTQKFAKYLPYFGFEPIIITKKTKDPFPFDGRCISMKTLPINWPFHLESFTWIPGLIWCCFKLITKEKIKFVLVSCGPFPLAVVGVILKKILNVKFILDYRDYWTLSPYISMMSTYRRILNCMEKPLEKFVLKFIDCLILVRKKMQIDYNSCFPFLQGKTETIYNGFDEDDIPKIINKEYEKFRKFTILYLGTLHLDLNTKYPVLLLKSIQKMKADGLINASNFQLLIIGDESKCIIDKINESGLSEVVKMIGRLPHAVALEYLSYSHILLLLDETDAIFPSKAFEYLATGKPILALIRSKELIDMIKKYSFHSIIISSYNTEEIISGIKSYFNQKSDCSDQNKLTDKFRREFNRKELTRQLVKILTELSSSNIQYRSRNDN